MVLLTKQIFSTPTFILMCAAQEYMWEFPVASQKSRYYPQQYAKDKSKTKYGFQKGDVNII